MYGKLTKIGPEGQCEAKIITQFLTDTPELRKDAYSAHVINSQGVLTIGRDYGRQRIVGVKRGTHNTVLKPGESETVYLEGNFIVEMLNIRPVVKVVLTAVAGNPPSVDSQNT